jgi:hypothetical protein
MEYVIIAVLIAAACLCAVIAFRRAVMRGWGITVRTAVADSQTAGDRAQAAGEKATEDAKVADEYNKLFGDRE